MSTTKKPLTEHDLARLDLRGTGWAVKTTGLTKTTLYRMIERGELRAYKVGSRIRFHAPDVLALFSEIEPGDALEEEGGHDDTDA